jgi:hypothetical protein
MNNRVPPGQACYDSNSKRTLGGEGECSDNHSSMMT